MLMHFPHLFGPVHSRRLGLSLGVDMVPYKKCTCNCVYCECGGVPALAPERSEYVKAEELIGELRQFISQGNRFNYITFAGSGEPTMNSALGAVIRFIKNEYPTVKTALLTNSTLFHLPEVRNDILPCDLILPSLDAVSESVFQKINRPHHDVHAQQLVDGLIAFSRIYRGQLWVEVFIVPGVNDTREELQLLREALLTINPSRVQLNSLDRPGACEWVTTAQSSELQQIADYFSPLPVEIIARKALKYSPVAKNPQNLDGTILHQLQRRPATIEEIAVLCGMTINDIIPAVTELVEKNMLKVSTVDGRSYYNVTASS